MDGIHVSTMYCGTATGATKHASHISSTQLCHNMEPVDASRVEVVLHVIASSPPRVLWTNQ